MKTRHQTHIWLSAIACVLIIGQGCSSHSVGYKVGSEAGGPGGGDEYSMGEMSEDGTMPHPSGDYAMGRSFYESGESYDPGAVGHPRGSGYSSAPNGMDIKNGHYNGLQYFEPGSGTTGAMSEYGHNYGGVGYGANNGPVTGFGSGSADGVNPDPESWADAFLRGNGAAGGPGSSNYGHNYSGAQGYGSGNGPVSGFGYGYAEGVNPGPEGWTNPSRRDGGLEPEHVGQDMQVAQGNAYGSSAGHGANGYSSNGHHGISETSLGTVPSSSFGSGGGSVQDVYFAFDSWKISKNGAHSLQADAEWINNNPGQPVTIEGHCDERGTQDYNMVLGKKRAEVARDYLIDLGVNPGRLHVVSYGKERPFCSESNENCHQQNRRGHLVVQPN